MIKYNFLIITLLAILLVGCGGKNSSETFFSFNEKLVKPQYTNNEKMVLALNNPQNKTIDSVVYLIDNKRVGTSVKNTKFTYSLNNSNLGFKNLKTNVYFDGNTETDSTKIEIVSSFEPKELKYKVLNVYAHDTTNFTEGFEFYGNDLLESTGLNGKSVLKKYELKSGKILNKLNLDSQYFGEGITVVNDKIYQLTWQQLTGFIYDAKTFKLEKKFDYNKQIEGWGMTNDGKNIYQSDGTNRIWKMNPSNQKMIDSIDVYAGATKIDSLNELEYINGKLFANIWQKNAIVIIDPKIGAIENIINLADLKKQLKYKNAEVLNGIAYNKNTKTIFVTGKNWDKMFEIEILK